MRIWISWGLLTLFLFPSLLQFEHVFESHKHEGCQEAKIHFHEKELDCSVYDFHYSSFNYPLFAPIQFFNSTEIHSVEKEVYLPHIEPTPLGFALRGPPMFS